MSKELMQSAEESRRDAAPSVENNAMANFVQQLKPSDFG